MADEDDPFKELRPYLAPKPVQEENPFEALRQAKAVAAAEKEPQQPQGFWENAADVGGATAAGIGRGIVSLPGIVGDVGQLASRSPAYAAWASNRIGELTGSSPEGAAKKAYEAAIKPIEARMTPEERAGMAYRIAGIPFPTGQKLVKGVAENVLPQIEYEGRSPMARVAGTIGEFAGQIPGTSVISGGTRALLKAPKAAGLGTTTARELGTAVGAGTASGVAGEKFRGTQDEAAVRALAAIPGALAGRVAAGRFTPGAAAERGQRIAGEVLRRTEQNIPGSVPPMQSELVPGVYPTLGQVYGPRAAALESVVAPGTSEAPSSVIAQQRRSLAAMEEAAGEIPGEVRAAAPDASRAYGPPLAVSSEDAQRLYRAVQEPALAAYKAAWEHPAFLQARYTQKSVLGAINAAVKEMGNARLAIPKDVKDQIGALRGRYPGNAIPFADVQRLKADLNALRRNPAASPSAREAAIELTTKLDDVMTDTNSVAKIFMRGVNPNEVGQAFDNARNLAREYKTTFKTPTTAPLSEVFPKDHTLEGQRVIPPEEFLSRVLKTPDQALAKYRELQGINGLDISRPVSDWVVTHIQGGKAVITPKMIANERKSPSFDTLIKEVPGLEQRLDLIAQSSRADQVAQSLTNAIQKDPKKLGAWLRANDSELVQNLPPETMDFVDRLRNSASLLERSNLSEGLPAAAQKNFDLLSKGDLFTLLHGRALGLLAGGVTGYTTGKTIGAAVPTQIALDAIGAGAGAVGAGIMSGPKRIAARVVYGTTQEEAMAALQRAMVDPKFAAFLASKPSEANAMKLRGLLRETVARGAPAALASERIPRQPPPPEETTEEKFRKLEIKKRFPQRPQRATGGRIVNLKSLARSAKKAVCNSTEDLLKTPDEHVVKALEIANRSI